MIWWLCENNHEWKSKISNRTNGRGCPYCTGKKASATNNIFHKFPEIAAQWHPTKNGNITPDQITYGSKQSFWFLCEKNHEWESMIFNRTTHRQGCPYCCTSYTHLEKVVENKLGLKKLNQRCLKNSNFRPDFKLSDSIYMNIDGLYWHSELYKDRKYHFGMRQAYENEGKRILQFYQDEIYDKWDIVKSIIDYTLYKNQIKISARKCEIVKTTTKKQMNSILKIILWDLIAQLVISDFIQILSALL